MSQFNCPQCEAVNRPSPGEIGCSACGFGKVARPTLPEQQPMPRQPQQTEVAPPPGYKGKYLTEAHD